MDNYFLGTTSWEITPSAAATSPTPQTVLSHARGLHDRSHPGPDPAGGRESYMVAERDRPTSYITYLLWIV